MYILVCLMREPVALFYDIFTNNLSICFNVGTSMLLGGTWAISHVEQEILSTTAGGVIHTGKKIARG